MRYSFLLGENANVLGTEFPSFRKASDDREAARIWHGHIGPMVSIDLYDDIRFLGNALDEQTHALASEFPQKNKKIIRALLDCAKNPRLRYDFENMYKFEKVLYYFLTV